MGFFQGLFTRRFAHCLLNIWLGIFGGLFTRRFAHCLLDIWLGIFRGCSPEGSHIACWTSAWASTWSILPSLIARTTGVSCKAGREDGDGVSVLARFCSAFKSH